MLYLIFLSELSSVDKTMIFFSIIFSCILISVSEILEEKHIIFDDPVHGPHDRCSQSIRFQHPDLGLDPSQIVSPVSAKHLLRGLRSLAHGPRLPLHDDGRGAEAVLQVGRARRGGGLHHCVP